MDEEKIIVFVEDDEDDRIFFKEAIEELKIPVRLLLFNDGKEFLDYLNAVGSTFPELVFLDLNMPRMSGLEILRVLRKFPKWSKIPVVICTTSAMDKDIQNTFMMGANIFFTKPNSFQMLKTALRKILVTNFQYRSPNSTWDNYLLKV
jgi:CheY-like chemotaxis protein